MRTGGNESKRKSVLPRVFEALCESQKVAVLHNSMADLLFMYYMFHRKPLKNLMGMKAAISSMFPKIFDTRTLVTLPCHTFSDMVQNLEGQYKYLRDLHEHRSITIELRLGCEAYDPLSTSGRGAHEAAYDAYMTGCLFLYLQQEMSRKGVDDVERHVNQIPVYGSVWTIQLHQQEDIILHDGPILFLAFVPGRALSRFRLDGILKKSELRGRLLFVGQNFVLFSPERARGTLFQKTLKKLESDLSKAAAGATVEVLKE